MTYYERAPVKYLDGTEVFATPEDQQLQGEVADALRKAWKCEIRDFGALCPVDCYAIRDGRMVGLIEIKARSHPTTKYPTVFLNVRKWMALTFASLGLACPAIFVVRFTNGILWVPLDDVRPETAEVGGCKVPVKSKTDVEPVIQVPVSSMRWLP